MRNRRIFPASVAITECPLSSDTRNIALGKTQRVIVKRGPPAPLLGAGNGLPLTGGIWDIAIPSLQQ